MGEYAEDKEEGEVCHGGPDYPHTQFLTKKGDREALSKFMDAVKILIVAFSDELAGNPDQEFDCDLRLMMGPCTDDGLSSGEEEEYEVTKSANDPEQQGPSR